MKRYPPLFSLKEKRINLLKIEPIHVKGFRTHNPEISKFALENKDQLAATILFSICSIMREWRVFTSQFSEVLKKLMKDGYLGSKAEPDVYSPNAPFVAIVTGKANFVNQVWNNREEIFNTIKKKLAFWSYGDKSKRAYDCLVDTFYYVTTIKGLALAKAGFVMQLITGEFGCYDSVNTQLYLVNEQWKKLLFEPSGSLKRVRNKSEKLVKERIIHYSNFLNAIMGDSSYTSQLMWDRWTAVVADRIVEMALAPEKRTPTVAEYQGREVTLEPYKVSKLLKPGDEHITGDDVSAEHRVSLYMP